MPKKAVFYSRSPKLEAKDQCVTFLVKSIYKNTHTHRYSNIGACVSSLLVLNFQFLTELEHCHNCRNFTYFLYFSFEIFPFKSLCFYLYVAVQSERKPFDVQREKPTNCAASTEKIYIRKDLRSPLIATPTFVADKDGTRWVPQFHVSSFTLFVHNTLQSHLYSFSPLLLEGTEKNFMRTSSVSITKTNVGSASHESFYVCIQVCVFQFRAGSSPARSEQCRATEWYSSRKNVS